MKLFVTNSTCTSGAHCAACRDQGAAGKKFRAGLTKSFELPDQKVDFVCPHGVPWGWKNKTLLPQPGDCVHSILRTMGYEAKPGCGCKAFQRQMNQWGWIGCWSRREEIKAWFLAKGREAGLKIKGDTITELIVKGLRGN